MFQPSYFWDLVSYLLTRSVLTLAVIAYLFQLVYNLKFHQLSKYPGPKIAAISNIWWAWNRYASIYLSHPTCFADLRKCYSISRRYP